MVLPLVTVVIPTTHDRKRYNEAILNNYIQQDYKKKEVLFDFEDGNVGAKLNRMIRRANGDVILRMDSDDKYMPDWISRQVKALMDSGADMTGLSDLYFYNEIAKEGYEYTYPKGWAPWIAGATMCFRKELWQQKGFDDIKQGEDGNFCWHRAPLPSIFVHDYKEGMVASIHEGNTSVRALHAQEYRRLEEIEEQEIRRRFFGA